MIYRTFLSEFRESNGASLIILLGFLTAIGIGCVLGVIPQVTTQRYAEVIFGYDEQEELCNSFSSSNADSIKPAPCVRGAEYAQSAASYAAVARYMMALLSNSVAGSYSDTYGRRGA
jgi:MFS family permease